VNAEVLNERPEALYFAKHIQQEPGALFIRSDEGNASVKLDGRWS